MMHTAEAPSSGLPLEAIVEDGMATSFSVILSMGARVWVSSSFAHQFVASAFFQPGACCIACSPRLVKTRRQSNGGISRQQIEPPGCPPENLARQKLWSGIPNGGSRASGNTPKLGRY